MKSIHVVSIQFNSTDNMNKNFYVVRELAKDIRKGQVDLISLPEAFSFCGSPEADFEAAEPYKDHDAISFLKELAKDKSSYVQGGTVLVKIAGSDKVRNRAVFVDPSGEIISYYDKIHLFDVNFKKGKPIRESERVEPGGELVVTKTRFGMVGFAICYDLRFPELFRELTRMGAEIIVVPAAFITKTGPYHWEILLRARAIENQVFIIATNQIGTHSVDRHTYGGSLIIDPWGEVLARAGTNEHETGKRIFGEIIKAKLDRKKLDEFRKNMPCLENARLLK